VTVDGLRESAAPRGRDAAGHVVRSSPGRLAQAHPAAGLALSRRDDAGDVDTGSQDHRGDITVETQPEERATLGARSSYRYPPTTGAGPGECTTGCGSRRRLA
jgi:hypothetical protein